MSDFEKAQRNLKNDMIVLFALQLIVIAYYIFDDFFNYFSIVYAVLFLAGYYFAKNRKNGWNHRNCCWRFHDTDHFAFGSY